ncbi:MAG TPA: STAS domain-containing protein [Candidatus Acidoferrales bacterium]|nr:STAS domain-containing protein [Candidatus Acidoferrales bacterium]
MRVSSGGAESCKGRAAQGAAVSLNISIREAGSVRVLDVNGRITIGEPSDRLHQELRYLAEHGWNKILVNLNDVLQIDSSGISSLVRNSMTLARTGGSLRLLCGPGRVRDALTVTRLIEAIPTFDNEATALASFE